MCGHSRFSAAWLKGDEEEEKEGSMNSGYFSKKIGGGPKFPDLCMKPKPDTGIPTKNCLEVVILFYENKME